MRQRWDRQTILDAAVELLSHSDGDETFSMRRLAAELGTDSSSLYRHFHNRTELMLAVVDHVLVQAMAGYRREGPWRARLVDLILRSWDAYAALPQLAKDTSHYPGSGPGTQLVIEETLQALTDAGLPEEIVPEWYHRLVTLSVSLISAHAAARTSSTSDRQRRLESFRVITLGADPAEFPALAHYARRLEPTGYTRESFLATLDVVLDAVPARP
ncbi:TetR/AcrR family transcriptional regulator [Phycicoccus sp. CSK15P-2]|uniref:TetR/AcrR family transcriptional regulator n=1 Tax=Phycicoccus sp. CSK15P-2 TaxID=2807627 RepID=UPI0019507E0B|nr:TetR/AcrR family transcriptional regulator [Phycicoccus sp. CSK15P-2]MBM6403809.1 TetR/AcrR family transcriptional regulator [Phycicoccus sp. CSK15P-2]